MINLAILLTCHNRKEKTLKSLKSLFDSLSTYNEYRTERIRATIYLTDDGCTDGTANAVKAQFDDKDIVILQGDGQLYWAGGMRFAWKEALKKQSEWDYYLLLNDDTIVLKSAFEEMINTHLFCINEFSRCGIYSGVTCSSVDHEEITYGGDIFINRITGTRKRLNSIGKPQMCDFTNANIMLVPKEVVSEIGILSDDYIHSAADFDYTFRARRRNIPVLVTGSICGICDRDHLKDNEIEKKVLSMSLAERKSYFRNPLSSGIDYLTLVKRTTPVKYPITWFFRIMNLYSPCIYYWFNKRR